VDPCYRQDRVYPVAMGPHPLIGAGGAGTRTCKMDNEDPKKKQTTRGGVCWLYITNDC
ncbi:MAG: hypothetical protein ACI8RD_008624, partial [Bacillariaceae sp.]|jgi:hypothetical protein